MKFSADNPPLSVFSWSLQEQYNSRDMPPPNQRLLITNHTVSHPAALHAHSPAAGVVGWFRSSIAVALAGPAVDALKKDAVVLVVFLMLLVV